jgi:hypothetical protein
MTTSEFYQTDPLAKIAINLFYGWGYNFYRLENQLRADDQLVRARAASLLGSARASVETAEAAYRREHMPAPTRDKPFPDAGVIADAQALERLSHAIGALEAQIRTQPVPENDRMSQRYRQEASLLTTLGECDQMLVGQAELLRLKLDRAGATAILAALPTLDDGLFAIAETLRRRQAALLDIE